MSSLMHMWHTRDSYIPARSSERRNDVIETGASQLSATEESIRLRNRDQWRYLIDNTLIEMGRNDRAFSDADEEIIAPTSKAVAAAVKWALYAREMMLAAPGQTMPDGEGGVVIQHALPEGGTESFEAEADGKCSIWFYPRAPLVPVQIELEFADEAF